LYAQTLRASWTRCLSNMSGDMGEDKLRVWVVEIDHDTEEVRRVYPFDAQDNNTRKNKLKVVAARYALDAMNEAMKKGPTE